MEESFIKGLFTFVIQGEDLDLDQITENIKIKLSKVRKRVNQSLSIKSEGLLLGFSINLEPLPLFCRESRIDANTHLCPIIQIH